MSGSVETAEREPDRAAAADAIRALLVAAGLDPSHPALADTPEKAAEALIDLTAGYRTNSVEALGKGFPVEHDDPVVATELPLRFVCPHHLMPARGVAHVAFLPNGRVPGLARIARLIDALGHRLVLQEDLGRWIVDALHAHLGVKAAVAVIEARHECVAVEDFARRDAKFSTVAAVGNEHDVASLHQKIGDSLRRA